MVGKYEVYKDKSGKFRWRLTHTNGRVIVKSGEGYATKVSALKGIWNALLMINNN